MLALVAALLVPASVATAVRAAVSVPDARVELSAYQAQPLDCAPGEVRIDRPVAASGLVVARFTGETRTGAPCSGAAFVRASVFAKVLVAARGVRENEPVDAALAERELREGAPLLRALPSHARAARSIAAGQPIDEASVRTFDPAAPVHVELRTGALSVFATGRRVPCSDRSRACALLASGRRVEGEDKDGVLLVEIP